MTAKITIVVGPAGSGKTQRLLAEYRRALQAGPVGSALWLVPGGRNVEQLRGSLLTAELPACLRPQCYTFGQFAIAALAASPTPLQALNRLGQRELLRRLIARAERRGALDHFRPIAHTPGFLDLATRFIRELKRLEVWPEEFAQRLSGARLGARDTKLAELAGLYSDYQAELNRCGWYDPEGRFWAARRLLRAGQTRPFERLRAVFVDDFTDFTRTEHEILEILAERVERLVISLPMDSQSDERELFAKPAATLHELTQRHEVELVSLERRPSPAWPALSFLEQNVFRLPGGAPPAPRLDGVELIAAASARAEIEAVAARIKRLLVPSEADLSRPAVRAGDVLVVFRSLDAAQELVREVFSEYGVPIAIESSRPLGRCGVLSAITALVRLAWEDWPYRQLLAVLLGSRLRPDWPEASGAAAARAAIDLVRDLQVPRGARELLAQAAGRRQRLARRRQSADGDSDRADLERAERDVALGAAFLGRLAAALAALPERATPAGWADAIAALGQGAGVAPRADDPAEDDTLGRDDSLGDDDPLDVEAWNAALAGLRSVDRLGGLSAGASSDDAREPAANTADAARIASPELDRAGFWALWQDILRIEPLPESTDEVGRVRVLSAPAARGLRADYVFLCGLGEQAFPLAGADPSLLSDGEASALIAAGVPLPARAQRSRDEMLLFYQAITRPRRGLCLSYAALDAKAQPLLPSPYLAELEQLCGARWPRPAGPLRLSPLPDYDEPLGPRDLRLLAVARGRDRDASLLAELFRGPRAPSLETSAPAAPRARRAVRRPRDQQPAAPAPASSLANNVRQGLLMFAARVDARFGAFDGLLESQPARDALAARFGPQSLWSASQLEEYVTCPFAFFMNRILKLEPLDELDLAVDYPRRGLALHGALSRLHRHVNQRAGRPAPLGDEAETLEAAAELLRQLCAPRSDETPFERAMRELDRRLLEAAMSAYYEQQGDYEKHVRQTGRPLLPAHFEVSFGSPLGATDAADAPDGSVSDTDAEPADPVDPLSTDEPFRFDCGGETVLIRGRIDRIDLAWIDDRIVFNVLDYKSGRPGRLGRWAVDAGLALQLPLYALAAAELLLPDDKAALFQAGYWFLKGSGYAPAVQGHKLAAGEIALADGWLELRQKLARWVLGAVRGVRAGQFPVFSRDDDCTGRCPYRTVCRVNQVRSLHKLWQPTDEVSKPSA